MDRNLSKPAGRERKRGTPRRASCLLLLAPALTALLIGPAAAVSAQPAPTANESYSLLVNASPLVGWKSFQESLPEAGDADKKILVDIFAASCGWCRKMQEEAYTNTEVLEFVSDNFIPARLDIEVLDDTLSYKDLSLSSGQLAYGFGATGTPTTVFLMPNGDYITRLPGYAPTDEFLRVLKYIASDAFLNQTYEEFAKSLESGD